MKYLNGSDTQLFNPFPKRVGPLSQGCFKAIQVGKESYFLELTPCIVLNPVTARILRTAKDWLWNSCQATAGFNFVNSCFNDGMDFVAIH